MCNISRVMHICWCSNVCLRRGMFPPQETICSVQAICQVLYNVCSVVGCAVTVVPEHLVRACLHDGTLTTPSVTPATSSVTRASAVLSVGGPIVPLLKGKWFSACAVASEFHLHSLSLVSLSILDSIFFERISGSPVRSTIVIHQWKNRSCGAFKILTNSALVLVLKNTEGLQSTLWVRLLCLQVVYCSGLLNVIPRPWCM